MRILELVRRGAALLLALALLTAAALAEVLALPEGLTAIEAEAFAGDGSIREVAIPDGAASIGPRAFADCAGLGWITIPGSVTGLGEGCLDGCAEDLLIRTSAGSAAADFARANCFDYQADTVYRAVLVGQSYRNQPETELHGPENDVAAMQRQLTRFDGTKYQVSVYEDMTADGILGAIQQTLGSAREQDVSLFYYSGHGVNSNEPSWQGAMYGTDGRVVTAGQLRAALDRIPGRKIVLIDACYSGSMISPNMPVALADAQDGERTAEDFVDSFIAAFSRRSRGGLIGENYFVMTAAAEDELSYESGYSEDDMMGVFTASLLKGCGYDRKSGGTGKRYADANGNGVLTLQELYRYVWSEISESGQHAQVYPSDCGWFGMFRVK